MDAFYETVTTFSFTLLGLWWAVIQFRYEAWIVNSARRRLAHAIHLSFLVPGVMSLGAMLTGDEPLIWRGTFIVASLVGLVATLIGLVTITRQTLPGWFFRVAQGGAACIYALILIVALYPDVLPALGWSLRPLQLEGIFVSLLVTVGVSIAWAALTSPA